MKHTDEERVGENQPLETALRDAADFLHQLRREGIIDSEQALNARGEQVFKELRDKAVYARYNAIDRTGSEVIATPSLGPVAGIWTQSFDELEFGIRQAWKHSRKCIMRSEYKDLKLCDLRHVKTSVEMGSELVSALIVAFNAGEIRPTVFVFPPRQPNERGPMIWNSNLLSFAGYTQPDGGMVLGDPANVELTAAIIDLGWQPPKIRTRWDVLPIVTMAQGDKPVITELPRDVFPLVHIQHPKHNLAFDKLGLRWVPAPALSRLGFTIGGVHYTASPFIGWFMDAEIGVRNLVDPFRYNVLPQVIRQLGLFEGDLNDLPDFERLAYMSRAQTELNYAVSWSFAKAKIRMIDSLGASELFARFDDEHLARHGHRLASDPYWIAPPQGSIVPLWHRGGSPNYQPKPMICHHRQDPVKAWRREHTSQACREIDQTSRLSIKLTLGLNPSDNHGRIFIGYCSSGTVALKLCQKLEGRLADAAKANTSFGKVMPIRALNALKNTSFAGGDVLVIIASNTRKGEMPINGVEFLQALQTDDRVIPGRYAIFGNGSMDYVDTYCQTAKLLENLLLKRRLSPVIETIYADTAIENPPWTAFSQFSMQLVQSLHGLPPTPESEREAQALETVMPAPTRTHFEVAEWSPANIVEVVRGPVDRSTKTVTIDVGDRKYAPMSYVSILPPNQATEVGDILSGLNARGDESLACANGMPIRAFLHYYADLQGPFRDVDWAYDMMSLGTVKPDDLRSLPVIRAVSRLPTNWRHWTTMEQLCSAIPRIQPRKYSIASDYDFNKTKGAQPSQLELFVQHHDGGRFSDCCLGDIQTFPSAVCRIEKNSNLTRLAGATDTPLVLFSTGSGIAPIRALLQHRMNLLESKSASSPHHAPITLISGHKASDHDLVKSIVAEARPLGLFDAVSLTPSNPEGRRAQDAVFAADMRDKVLSKIKAGGTVFVCARPEAEEDFVVNLRAILGVVDARRILGDRYVSEIYQHAV